MADGGHTLVIDGLSEATLRGLEALASAHGRPIDAEARELLQRSVETAAEDAELAVRTEAFLKEAAEIRAMAPKGAPQRDSTLLIREARDNGYWRDI